MKIKNILTACLLGFGLTAVLVSCSKDEDAFYTVSEDDAPRILNTDFPDGGYKIERNNNLKIEVLVTPVDFTTVKLYLDDEEKFTGANIDVPVEAGDYTMKIVATTVKGKSTSRTMPLTVKPLDSDPTPGEELADRLVKAGAAVKLHGENMSNIKKVVIANQEIAVTYNSDEKCIEYTVPATLANGTYRISVVDDQNVSYGAGKLTVTTKSTVSKATFAGTSKGSVTLEGFYLDNVASISVNGVDCTITGKTENSLTFTAPELAVGDYDLKGTTTGGEAVLFYKDGALTDKALFIVSEEEILWMGDFTVDWDGPEDHKEWRMISQEKFATFEIGHTLNISLKLVGTDYHKAQFDNWSWASLPIPNAVVEFGEDTVVSIEITQALKDAVAAQAFCIHGHGFSVVQATYK